MGNGAVVDQKNRAWSHFTREEFQRLAGAIVGNVEGSNRTPVYAGIGRKVPALSGIQDESSDEPARLERVAALQCLAETYGGARCRIVAGVCKSELGALRDTRFLAPALRAKRSADRLRAVECSAFLQGNLVPRLHSIALTDPEPGIRAVAAWAYGFAGGPESRGLLDTLLNRAETPWVKDFAKKALRATQQNSFGWWRL